MKKISTVFKKDQNDLSRVIDEVNPENQWVLDGEGIATQKFDGTACAVINGELYKRYDVKKGRSVPEGAIPCQEADPITGHYPHWIKCDRSKAEDKYHWQAWDYAMGRGLAIIDTTYELIGPKINGNAEKMDRHYLSFHKRVQFTHVDRTFEGIRKFLAERDIEGIVFHHPDGRMAKIRKSDFGIKR